MFNHPEGADGLKTMLRRATLLKTDDTGTQQILRKLRGNGERPEDVVRFQDHGISSHAPAGSEGWLAALGGRSDRLAALGFQHKEHRPKNLPEGGVALYDADGKILKIVKDETVFDAGGKPFTVKNATKITIQGKGPVAVGVDGRWIRITDARVDLGMPDPDSPAPAAVVTTAGPSTIVFAKV
jgi:phage gp45-like